MIKRIAEWVIRLEWPILALVSPLLLFPNAKRSLALLGIPLLWTARRIARGRFIRRTPLDWAIALMMLMVLVSLYATYDIAVSLPKITGILLGIAVYYALVELDSNRLRWALAIYLTGGIGLAIFGTLGAQRLNKVPLLSGLVTRLPMLFRGLPGAETGLHPNEVAGALLWFIPLYYALGASAWYGWRKKVDHWGRALLLLAAGLATTLALIFTQSRSGVFGLGLALLLFMVLGSRVGRAAVSVIVIAGVVGLAVVGPSRVIDAFMGGPTAASAVTGTLDANSRLEVWSRALYAIQDFPFTGTGMNTFRDIMPVLYPAFLISPDFDIGHAHNHLLQAALDLGLPGLVAYLAIWLTTTIMLLGIWQRSPDRVPRAVSAGVGAGLVAFFVYGMTDTVALGAKPGVAFWALLAIASALFVSLTPPEAQSA